MKQEVYCSFCRLPHRVYVKKHTNLFETALFALVGGITTYLIWQDFHWIAILIFMILSVTAEMIHRARWRQSIKCKSCGFDPMIYMKNPEEAAVIVKAFLDHRKEDPLYLLRPQPRIKPIIKKVKDFKTKNY